MLSVADCPIPKNTEKCRKEPKITTRNNKTVCKKTNLQLIIISPLYFLASKTGGLRTFP